MNEDDICGFLLTARTLSFCESLEKKYFIYQNGIIGKVVRVEDKDDVLMISGLQFITREEKNYAHFIQSVHFLKDRMN